MATTATPSKLSTAERMLITQSLSYYHKGTQRAINTSTEDEIKEHHKRKLIHIQALIAKLSSQELDI